MLDDDVASRSMLYVVVTLSFVGSHAHFCTSPSRPATRSHTDRTPAIHVDMRMVKIKNASRYPFGCRAVLRVTVTGRYLALRRIYPVPQ